ncbi:MAG: hypothetical protein IPM56_00240 [Ignavibacteriales bacterium]|nr:MAG: hypothetical protein IPM56_00240 [Ignavibacteriales bacterium]
MNYRFVFLFVVIFSGMLFPSGYSAGRDTALINFIRNTFYESVEDEDKTYSLEKFITAKFGEDQSKYDPVILAYFGAVEALKGKHAFNPFSKLNHVIRALDIIEVAVKKEPRSLEIRFVRFSILHHLPGILGYGSERDEDLLVICQLLKERNYSEVNPKLQQGIVQFMIDSERLDDTQLEDMKRIAITLADK